MIYSLLLVTVCLSGHLSICPKTVCSNNLKIGKIIDFFILHKVLEANMIQHIIWPIHVISNTNHSTNNLATRDSLMHGQFGRVLVLQSHISYVAVDCSIVNSTFQLTMVCYNYNTYCKVIYVSFSE